MVAKLKALPELRDVATDQQNDAAQATLVIDRDTASRLGVTASAIDNTLYDAFGQRLVSIMFTQLNQYHVVLQVDPKFGADPDSLKSIYVPAGGGAEHRDADTWQSARGCRDYRCVCPQMRSRCL